MASVLVRTKSPEQLLTEAEAPERKLKRALGPLDLTALGVGATIGAGIFALTGTAAAGQQTITSGVLDTPLVGLVFGQAANGRPAAGPAIMVSFLIVAIACAFAGFCYAELAAMIPVAGSAYTYAYATLGELFAWIIGWDLILEYAVGNIAVASSWSGYFVKLAYSLFGLKHAALARRRSEDGRRDPHDRQGRPICARAVLVDGAAAALRPQRRRQPAGVPHRRCSHLAPHPRHPGERGAQHRRGDLQGGRRRFLRRLRRLLRQPGPTGTPSRRTASPAS